MCHSSIVRLLPRLVLSVMSCHFSDRLPWPQLAEMYLVSKAQTRGIFNACPFRFSSPVKQFVYSFIKQLEEFKATDKSTCEELAYYDPKEWGEYGLYGDMPFTQHPHAGYYESLLWGYVSLNLLITDPVQIYSRMQWHAPLELRCLLGSTDESHPSHLSRHLRPAFPDSKLAPATPEILQILRDHAARMFRCMYSVTGENKLLDEKIVTDLIYEYFGWERRGATAELSRTDN